MQEDFHYYATYCAAYLAGYSHEECMDICYSAQLVDLCSKTFLNRIKGPKEAATTQLQLEMMDMETDLIGLMEITRIWASFHFLPYDLYAEKKFAFKSYRNKFRLICGPNGDLVSDTVNLARGSSLQAVGIAMHVVADTWAHRYFAGTPSLVINNTDYNFYELLPQGDGDTERHISFRHSVSSPDDIENGLYTGSLFQSSEDSVMNLGHGRAGHFPDYSFARYRYMPAWNNYREVTKDNPTDYRFAFCQMIHAMKYINGSCDRFEKAYYDTDAIAPYEDRIRAILEKRQLIASDDWKAFGEELSGQTIEDFDLFRYVDEYTGEPASSKSRTFLGRFVQAAIKHKSMVTDRIYRSGNPLAGRSVSEQRKDVIRRFLK